MSMKKSLVALMAMAAMGENMQLPDTKPSRKRLPTIAHSDKRFFRKEGMKKDLITECSFYMGFYDRDAKMFNRISRRRKVNKVANQSRRVNRKH